MSATALKWPDHSPGEPTSLVEQTLDAEEIQSVAANEAVRPLIEMLQEQDLVTSDVRAKALGAVISIYLREPSPHAEKVLGPLLDAGFNEDVALRLRNIISSVFSRNSRS